MAQNSGRSPFYQRKRRPRTPEVLQEASFTKENVAWGGQEVQKLQKSSEKLQNARNTQGEGRQKARQAAECEK